MIYSFRNLLSRYRRTVFKSVIQTAERSVIEHEFSYGNEKDLLEISGLMTEKEEKETQDTVLGYLTAENVFERIKKHYKDKELL